MIATVLAAAKKRSSGVLPQTTEVPPYEAVICNLPPYTPTGTLNAIHPSVIGFDQPWNGFRWWMANTPYPTEAEENPCIYVSHDRINWQFAPGVPVPLDAWPDNGGGYNSDTELVMADNGDMVCIYRESGGGGYREKILARVSSNGTSWSDEIFLFSPPELYAGEAMSPAVVRFGPGDYRMWTVANGYLTAPHPLGPWQFVAGIPAGGHHIDVILAPDGETFIKAASTGATGADVTLSLSTDGLTWTPTLVVTPGVIGSYRPTLFLSDKPGWVDMWVGGGFPLGSSTQTRTAYTRFPLSALGIT